MPGKSACVVFINHWAKKLGGAEYSLLDILSYNAPRIRSYLVTSEAGPLTTKASLLNIECRIIPCSLKPGKNMREHFVRVLLFSGKGMLSFIRYVFSLSRFIKTVEPEIIHANVPLSHVALFLLVLLGYRGKCFFHMREIFKKKSLPSLFYQFFFPFRQGRIFAISESVKQNLPFTLRTSALVVYNGVKVPEVLHKRRAADGSSMRFLYLGRVVPWKGCHDLISIFAKVNNRQAKETWALSLVGDTVYWSDKYRRRLQGQIQSNGLESNCILLPHTDDPAWAIRSHDVFVNASFQEPFGRSIAEAQAEGLPVVAYDSGGIREIVENERTGLLVTYGDEEGFVRAVARLLDDRDEASAMGKRGHERMKRFFNRDFQMPKICDELLSNSV
jgi:glycosyltransferase involved in cell wall biosynthesis